MRLTTQQVRDAREWLLDCFSSDEDQERIEKCCHELIERAIVKYFDGGIDAFIASCEPLNVCCN